MDQITQIILEVEALKENSQYEKAIDIVEKSILKYENDYRLYEELGDIYIHFGKYENAHKALDFSLELNPDSATGNYLKGFLLLTVEKVTQAIGYLELSNKLMQNNPEVLRNLGWAYFMIGNTDKGIAILKRALVIAPEDSLIIEDLDLAIKTKLETGL